MPILEASETLFNALDNGNMADVNEELDKFPESVNGRDEEQRLPLHYAADCADMATFVRILDLNSSLLDAQDLAGFTPLLVSVMAGNVDIMKVLIERGAQLAHVDRDKHSAVHWAVVCGQLETLICLLKHGAPSDLPDAHGAYPLHYATVIEDVSEERAATILYVLLKQEDSVNCVDSDGRTPLLWASSNGNLEAFKSLVQAGANKLAVDRDRLGVLHCAASHGHLEIVRTMLDMSHRNVVNIKDRNGDTPLFYASTFGHYECEKLLLESGADANHMDKRLRTAAHCAAAKGQLHILKLLKQYGASFQLQNYRGDLAFHEAVQTGSKELVEWLLTIEPKFINATNFYGRTPLHLAAASGNMELVVFLCTRGSDINPLMLYKNQLYTPLDLAKRREHDLVVDYLSQRHDALTSQKIAEEKRNFSRSSIEEQLKTAKLRKVRAQVSSSGESDSESWAGIHRDKRHKGHLKVFLRGKSMQSVDSGGEPRNQRRSSSASGVRLHNLPSKSTSTTDLTKQTSDSMLMTGMARKVSGKLNNTVFGDMERQLVEDTIQKILQDELRKTSFRTEGQVSSGDSRKENISPDRPKQDNKNNSTKKTKGYLSDEEGHASSSTQQSDLLLNGKHNGAAQNSRHKKRVQMLAEEAEPEVSNLSSASLGRNLNSRAAKDLQLTELHIIEDSWEPPHGRMTFIESNTERRYVHEKAIFEELTHLKRMQIQYGKVQEKVLVRSLINNFCRMHALNPAHFRYQSFYDWEKFLYDQLKLIYLEERDRIQLSTANAAHLMALNGSNLSSAGLLGPNSSKFDNRLHKAAPLDDRLRELTRIYSSSTAASTARHAAVRSRINTELTIQKKRALPRRVSVTQGRANGAAKSPARSETKNSAEALAAGKRCECLGKHLLIS